MYKRIIAFALISVSVFLTGCQSAVFGNRDIESTRVLAIEDEDALFTAVTIRSERRLLIVDELDKTVCGEPMTDAVDAYSQEFADQVGKAIRKGKIDADTGLAMVGMYDNITDQMIVAQGLTYSRVQLYHLCIARQNGFINNQDYKDGFRSIIEQSARLIALEIPTMRNAQAEEMERLRDYLQTALETSNELAEAFSEHDGGVLLVRPEDEDDD